MRRFLGRVALIGAVAGAVIALRGYLKNTSGPKQGNVQRVLDDGKTTVEPEAAQAREFVDLARGLLQIGD